MEGLKRLQLIHNPFTGTPLAAICCFYGLLTEGVSSPVFKNLCPLRGDMETALPKPFTPPSSDELSKSMSNTYVQAKSLQVNLHRAKP